MISVQRKAQLEFDLATFRANFFTEFPDFREENKRERERRIEYERERERALINRPRSLASLITKEKHIQDLAVFRAEFFVKFPKFREDNKRSRERRLEHEHEHGRT
jgi:hypothetical protein